MNLKVDEMIGHISVELSDSQKKRGILIYAFQKIQKEYNYLPGDVLNTLSHKLNIPLSNVYSTASFYKQFYFTSRGNMIVRVCTGTACHVRGADDVLTKNKDEFKIEEGQTTPDPSMTLENVRRTACISY